MALIYRFLLRKGSTTATAVLLHPIWKDDLAIEWQREQGQLFMRANLSGSIDLQRDDYDAVMDSSIPFSTVFYLDIEKSSNNGSLWTLYWRGRFTRTDCKVNTDDRILTVKPDVYDQYTELLNGIEKEFDLIKLTPAIERILIRKRPCIQIYTQDDDTVDCIYGNQSFEQDAEIPSTYDNVEDYLKDRCHFSIISSYLEINFQQIPAGYESDFRAPFSGQLDVNVSGTELTNVTNTYYLKYFCRNLAQPDISKYKQTNGIDIYKRGESGIKWHFEQSRFVDPVERNNYEPLPEEIPFFNEVAEEIDMMAVKTSQAVFSRLVCSVDNVGTTPTYELYGDDIVADNRNYRRAVGYDVGVFIVQSSRTSANPTKWGRTDSGDYFLPPDDSVDWIPIGRSRWVNTSLWFNPSQQVAGREQQATYTYILNDAYPLHACIDALLTAIGTSVNFADTIMFSEFLYRKNNGAYKDPIANRDCRMFLTPKSNITAGEYQTPAMKGLVTLKDILDMLRDTYRLYWYVDAQDRLCIEHVSWFENGGSYSGSPVVGIDLTAMTNRRNGKTWDFAVNTYEYEKSEMPQRYQFGWMDEVTDMFRGEPIEVVSPYVSQGEIEEINVSLFDSDVDYMLLQPSAISLDGFALLSVGEANAIVPGESYYQDGVDGAIFTVASYVGGKACYLQIALYGSGTATLVWWYGNEAEESSLVFTPPLPSDMSLYATVAINIPQGVTGISFIASATVRVALYGLRLQSDVQGNTETLMVPMRTETRNNTLYRMQNGNLSFFVLQNPYWLYDLPASQVSLNGGAATSARSVRKCRKQTVSIPLGDSDPDMKQLVKTGLGNGQIYSMSIRLTSRMAKTVLRYDTEQ